MSDQRGRLRRGRGVVAPDHRRKVHGSRYTITVVRHISHDAPPLSRRTVRRTLSTNRSTVSCEMPVCSAMQGAHRDAPLARAITIRPQSSASLLADTDAVLSYKRQTHSTQMALSGEILPSASRLAPLGDPRSLFVGQPPEFMGRSECSGQSLSVVALPKDGPSVGVFWVSAGFLRQRGRPAAYAY